MGRLKKTMDGWEYQEIPGIPGEKIEFSMLDELKLGNNLFAEYEAEKDIFGLRIGKKIL